MKTCMHTHRYTKEGEGKRERDREGEREGGRRREAGGRKGGIAFVNSLVSRVTYLTTQKF